MSLQAVEILTELQRHGVTVAVDGDTLCLKPRHALDDTLLGRVREAKPAILEALRNRPTTSLSPRGSPHCAGCHDVGSEKKIHPPKCGEKYRKSLERREGKGRVQ